MSTTCNFRQSKEIRHQPKPPSLPAPRLHSTQATRQDVLRHQRSQRRWAKRTLAKPVISVDVWDVFRVQRQSWN